MLAVGGAAIAAYVGCASAHAIPGAAAAFFSSSATAYVGGAAEHIPGTSPKVPFGNLQATGTGIQITHAPSHVSWCSPKQFCQPHFWLK